MNFNQKLLEVKRILQTFFKAYTIFNITLQLSKIWNILYHNKLGHFWIQPPWKGLKESFDIEPINDERNYFHVIFTKLWGKVPIEDFGTQLFSFFEFWLVPSNALISSWRPYFVTMGLKFQNALAHLFLFLSF
jgi:hypothetical protein